MFDLVTEVQVKPLMMCLDLEVCFVLMSWFTGGQMLNHWRSVKTRFSRVLSYSLICIFICPSFLMFWCIIFLQTLVEIQQIMCDLLQINTTTSFILWSCDKIKQSAANPKEFTVDPSKHSAANSLHEEESHLSAHYGGVFFFFLKSFALAVSAHRRPCTCDTTVTLWQTCHVLPQATRPCSSERCDFYIWHELWCTPPFSKKPCL